MEFIHTITEQILTFFDAFPAWLTAVTTLVVAVKAVTILTPTRADDRTLDAVLRFLNVLALNIGQDRNADDVPRDNIRTE